MTEQVKDKIQDQEIDFDENEFEELDEAQLDELSPETHRSYQKKAEKSIGASFKNRKNVPRGSPEAKTDAVKNIKRMGAVDRSKDKEMEGEFKKLRAARAKNEEFENTIEEDINAIFSGEGLSEEFKSNAKAIFEAAVLSKVDERAQALEEEYTQKLEEEIASINENVISKVDEYLEYVVSEWVEENKLAIDSGIRSEIAEDFMQGLKNLFQEHYIDIPEEKVDMVEELASKVEELESELDKMVTENTTLNAEIGSYKKDVIVDEISEGLTEVQAAKLSQLAENIEFVSEEDYKEKVSLTKRKYFSESKEEDQETVKDQFGADEELETTSFSPMMEHYIKNLSKFTKK
jgi:hypothetical protein